MGGVKDFNSDMDSAEEVGKLATKAILGDRGGALRPHSVGQPMVESWPRVIQMLAPNVTNYHVKRVGDEAPGPLHATLVMEDGSKIHYFLLDPDLD